MMQRRGRWLTLILVALGVALALAWLSTHLFFQTGDRTWSEIQQGRPWRVGMDPSFPPFEMLNESGEMVGYDVDLAKALAAEMNVELSLVATGFDGLLDALLVGRVDTVISALPYDPRLTQDVRYTTSYFEAGLHLVIRDGTTIASVDDLAGRKVAVEWGSGGDAQARQLQRQGIELQRLPLPSADEAVAALLAGESDALLVDGVTLRLAQGQGAEIIAVGDPLEGDPYVMAVAQQAPQLHAALEAALTTLRARGTLADLEMRWFSPTQ